MALRELPLEAVTERDIDLLLLEELTVSEAFARWLVARVFSSGPVLQRVLSVRHSVCDASGESDLELIFSDESGRRLAVLIEDKIDAPAQPDQADRYRERAARGVEAGSWQEARTCLVAPREYVSHDADRYGVKIEYEEIAACFAEVVAGDARAQYRVGVMNAALEQARRGYTLVKDAAVTAFWSQYWLDAGHLFPELEMQDSGDRGAQATWIVFRPKHLASPRAVNHKLTMGVVDLTTEYSATRVPELAVRWASLLAPDMSVVATGKSLSVRVSVPPLEIRMDYSTQSEDARAGMRAAYRTGVPVAGAGRRSLRRGRSRARYGPAPVLASLRAAG